MSTCRIRRVGHCEGLCFCTSRCAHKKGVLCPKGNNQSLLKFAKHLPLGPVNVWLNGKNELWEQLR